MKNSMQTGFLKKWIFLATLFCMTGWTTGARAQTDVIRLPYCAIQSNDKSTGYPCIKSVNLNVPSSYFKPLPSSKKIQNSQARKYLEIAFPSGRSWSELPRMERNKSHKIQLEIRGLATAMNVQAYRSPSLKNYSKIRKADLPFGLEHYELDGNWADFYLPIDKSLAIRIRCADGGATQKQLDGRGCHLETQTGFSIASSIDTQNRGAHLVMNIGYRFDRKALAEWAEIHSLVNSLFEKFAAN